MTEMSEMFGGGEELKDGPPPEEPDDFDLDGPSTLNTSTAPPEEHAAPADDSEAAQPYTTINLATIEPEPVDWLWKRRVPRNMITVIEGHPSTGKSSLIMDLIARLTTGATFPEDEETREPMTILWVTQEDSPSQVLLPRLLAANGDAARVYVQTKVELLGGQTLPTATREKNWARVRATLDAVMPQLVVWDPGSALLEDGNSEAIVRQVMGELFDLGQERGITTLWIRHLAKASGDRQAMMAGIGSIGIAAAARSIFQVHTDFDAQRENDPHPRIFAHVKSNLGGTQETLKFGIIRRLLEGHDDIETAEVTWGGETPITAEEMFAKNANQKIHSRVSKKKVIEAFEEWAQIKGEFLGSEALEKVNELAKTNAPRLRDLTAWKKICSELQLKRVGTGPQAFYRYSNLE